jgi:alpha-L-fucosidase
VKIKGIKPVKKATIQLLGAKNSLKWKTENGEIVITIPAALQKTPPCNYAWTFKISQVE